MSCTRMLSFCFSLCFFACFVPLASSLIPARILAHEDVKTIERLVNKLGSDNFQDRETAMESLRRIGQPALPVLRKAQNSSDPEIRRLARLLVRQLDVGIQPLLNRRVAIRYYGGQKESPESVDAVDMVGPTFTDDDLIHLHDFTNIRTLNLTRARITNTGLARIAHLNKLEGLFISGSSVSDLSSLRDMKNLSTLYLGGTKITDESLTALKDLPNLSFLDLCLTSITDAGLAHLRHTPKLRQFDLTKTKVTDKGLAHLRDLKDLKYVRLDGTQITDAGLVHLNNLKKLEILILDRTKTTAKGINELQQSLPAADIYPHSFRRAKP